MAKAPGGAHHCTAAGAGVAPIEKHPGATFRPGQGSAISAVGALTLLAGRFAKTSNATVLTTISGVVVAGGVSVHAMLHGLEAPKDSSTLLWWGGALISSVLVCGGSYLLLQKLPVSVSKAAAVVFLALGGVLAFGPLGLLAGAAGA